MKKEELDNLIRDKTKWMLESEWNTALKEGQELVELQNEIFSSTFKSIIHESHISLSKEDVEDVIKLISDFPKNVSVRKSNVLICFFAFMLSECVRANIFQEGGREQ